MPIYEYICRNCGHELEQLQRLSEDPLTDCPDCGESALKRKVSAAGFRLSGGGWYETDFKSDGRRNLSGDKSEGSKESKSSGSGSSGSDSGKSGETKSGGDSGKSGSSGGDTGKSKKPAKKDSPKSASGGGS